MQHDFTLSLPPNIAVIPRDEGLDIGDPRGGLRLEGPMLALSPTLRALADGAREAELVDGAGNPALTPLVFYLLSQMDGKGLLSRSIRSGETRLATLIPSAGRKVVPARGLEADQAWRLSRFAYLRRDGEDMVLESPRAFCRLALHSPAASAALHRLAAPATARQLAADCGLSADDAEALLSLLVGGGFVEGAAAEETDAERLWEFHDLLFHARSRLGRHDQPYGGAYLFTDDIAPLPALKPANGAPLVALPTGLSAPSSDLQSVMARRKSIRDYGEDPIDLAGLGTLLHRAARHLRTIPTPQGELAARPYPAGGALHELELYLAVDRCEGLERGLYHYRGDDHALEAMSGSPAAVEGLLNQAAATLGGAHRPQVLVVVTARFQRLSWKYRSMVYALVLKHVGVLYQTLYLVATDLGLAPCAMGGGDSELFAEASGLDPLVEASVGEFALGSRGPDADAG